MLGPAHLQRVAWFHPVGTTTPVCLTQTLPPDADASILMLGCGDVRNVLFTVYSDLSTNNRRLDFTCCDIECEILARNIMLYTLIMLRSDSSIEKRIFSIYYDIMLDEDTLQILRWHATRLCYFAQSLEKWNSSNCGRYIRFMDSETLDNCRHMWDIYSTGPGTGTEFLELQSSLRHTIATAQEVQSCYMQNGKSYYGIKAFAPMAEYSPEIMALRYSYYWHRGVTKISDPPSMAPIKGDCVHMNPMFATRRPSLVMHHGTDPYRSMHMSTVFAPLAENSPLKPAMSDDIDLLYDVAVSQFKEYAEAFRKKIRNITIRVVNAEATALCHSLHCRSSFGNDHNSGWYRSTWGFEPLVLDNVRYTDPMAFDVIDTSNLADHVGCLNLISAASPLLKESHTSTLRVETAIIRDGLGPESGVDILGGHFAAISSIFGLGCMHYWTQNGNTPVFPEQALQDLPRSVFHGSSIYCRSAIEWRHMGAGNKLRMDDLELARIMAMMYVEMFGDEDPRSRTPRRHRHQQYSRASFVAAVGAIRKAVQVSNWDVVVEEVFSLVRQDCTVDFRYKEDFYLHMHLQGVYTSPRYNGVISYINQSQPGLLSQWNHIPSAICMTMVIPREKLEFVGNNFSLASLVAQVCLRTPNNRTHANYDCFQSVQMEFGRVHTTGKRYTETYSVTVQSDSENWEGTSDLIASAMIPTWKLLEHPSLQFEAAFSIRDFGDPQGTLSKELGEDLIIFSDSLSGSSIFLTQNRPHIPGPMWFSSLSARADNGRCPAVQFQPYYGEKTLAVEGVASPDLDVLVEIPARTVLIGDSILVISISAFQHIMQIPGWRGRPSGNVDLFLPMPVTSGLVGCDSLRPVYGRLKRSCYVPTLEWLFQQPNSLFPVFLDQGKPILQNLHYVNLDKLPVLDVSRKHDFGWVHNHITATLSYKEEVANHNQPMIDRLENCDVRVSFKSSLFRIFDGFIHNKDGPIPLLISNIREGRVFLVCPSAMRQDLSSKTLVLDCAVTHLNKYSLPYLRPWLDGTEPCDFKQIIVSDDELLMWKHTLPAFVERCRTWSHTSSCEYLSVQRIPLSTENMEPGIFCSCAYAFGSSSSSNKNYDIGNDQLLSCLTPRHAVRAALTLPFPTPFGPSSVDTDVAVWTEHIQPQKRPHPMDGRVRDIQWCAVCARTEDEEGVLLRSCVHCEKIWYCSGGCVDWDWYYGGHKAACHRLRSFS
ncbi:uncharacterized protein TRUGW13939_11207 [Talaromyces rugulosus]|uniref:MYND-type domain-containing protein n=1 Tax=Talaromyces rugulosus TaxID=121627 RepID=A0A7H8RCB2_TALRU|nr:uncharacterized protein TRUGW13939_11207 [Talaromyces rugulosus]QKX64034.1 hypothetical protein TRUGW13939_11207 [Talaromyces rugulosus]